MAERIFLFPNKHNDYELKAIQNHKYTVREIKGIEEILLPRFGLTLQFFERRSDIIKHLFKGELENDKAGVYILFGFNKISRVLEIYVGRSKHLKQRMEQHLRDSSKNCFVKAVIINTDKAVILNDLENALYANFKTRSNIIMHNDKIPEVDNDNGMRDDVLLERADIISYVLINHTFGKECDEFNVRPEVLAREENVFTYMKSIKGNVSLQKTSDVTGVLLKDSLIVVPNKLDGDRQLAFDKLLGNTSFKQQINHTGDEIIYKLTADKKINLHQFKILFGDSIENDLWMDAVGQTNKVIWK